MVRPLSALPAGEVDVAAGPEKIFARVEELFDRMLTGEHVQAGAPLFGIGIGYSRWSSPPAARSALR